MECQEFLCPSGFQKRAPFGTVVLGNDTHKCCKKADKHVFSKCSRDKQDNCDYGGLCDNRTNTCRESCYFFPCPRGYKRKQNAMQTTMNAFAHSAEDLHTCCIAGAISCDGTADCGGGGLLCSGKICRESCWFFDCPDGTLHKRNSFKILGAD